MVIFHSYVSLPEGNRFPQLVLSPPRPSDPGNPTVSILCSTREMRICSLEPGPKNGMKRVHSWKVTKTYYYVGLCIKIYDVGSFPNLSMFGKRFEKSWKNPYPPTSGSLAQVMSGDLKLWGVGLQPLTLWPRPTLRSRFAIGCEPQLYIYICMYMYMYMYVYVYIIYIYVYIYIYTPGNHHWFWIWKSLGIAWGQPICRYQAVPNLDQTHVSGWNCTTSDWGGCSAPPEPQELTRARKWYRRCHVGHPKINHPQSHYKI